MTEEATTSNAVPTATDISLRLFDRMRVRKARFGEIQRLLGAVDGQVCLDIVHDPALSAYLRQHYQQKGCKWHSAGGTAPEVEYLREMVGDKVYLLIDPELPFENGMFDAIVVSDYLEFVPGDEKFVAECHRILKPSGRLIVCVPRAGSWSFLRKLREWLGLVDQQAGVAARAGYSESQLFMVLKDGFDVQESRTAIRFGAALADIFCQLMTGAISTEVVNADGGNTQRLQKALRYYSILQPLFWLATALDVFLHFTKGYYIMARAKRRMWVPRRTPVLRDGRSIAEAALQSKIGTAAPF